MFYNECVYQFWYLISKLVNTFLQLLFNVFTSFGIYYTKTGKYILPAKTETKIIFVTPFYFYTHLKNYSTSANNILREAFYCHYLHTVMTVSLR